ncbi:DUF1896 family protein [Parafilimonas sp.]|uniref:DUF1896 family protein n=1 Tax=Parafilimonas sp. TaxID=1969739 RepID=UPI0039E4E15B
MTTALREKLWAYIVENNPELVFSLQEEHSASRYITEKVNAVLPLAEQLFAEGMPYYAIEEQCLKVMTEDLKPSRYQYIRSVIEEEFPEHYKRLKENGALTYEVVNLIEACKGIFNDFDFTVENEDNRHLRYAIIGQVHDYLV